MVFRQRLISYSFAGLLAFLGAMLLRRRGQGNLYDFAKGTLSGLAILFMLVGVYRARRMKSA